MQNRRHFVSPTSTTHYFRPSSPSAHNETNLPAAPLSTFTPPLTFTCSQTQWLHVKVRGGASEDSGAEKSMSDDHNKFSHLPLAAPALPRMRRNCLLQRCPASGPISELKWIAHLSFVTAVEAAATKLIMLRPPNFTIENKRDGKG